MRRDPPARVAPAGPVRAAIYRLLWEGSQLLLKVANGFLFLAAGLLRDADLQAMSRDEWRRGFAVVTDIDTGLTPAERQFYAKVLRSADRVLVVGCGAGRDLLALGSMVREVVGLEPVAELAVLAREHAARRGISVEVRDGLVQTAELGGRYDVVIFSNGCYSYIHHAQVRVAALARIREHLEPGGRVVCSYHPRARQSRLGHWLTSVATRVSHAGWRPEPGDTFWRHPSSPGVLGYYRGFTSQEFAEECAAAGLRVIVEEVYDPVHRFAMAEPIR